MLFQIISATPKWVFVLFAGLLWLGCKQLLASRVSLLRITFLPVAMAGLAVYGVISAFADSPGAMIGWAVSAVALASLVLQRPLPATTRYDAATRSFQITGSAVPLALMMGIFFTKYVVGVELAMHPELAHQHELALAIGTIYGAFSGVFAGRGIRLWMLAIRQDSQRPAGALASPQ
jgi:hypothetical protein